MRLKVNPIRCAAHGLCAELLPEHITLDEWGYPILDGQPIEPELEQLARRAANACPTLALLLDAEREADPATARPGALGPIRDGGGARRAPLARR